MGFGAQQPTKFIESARLSAPTQRFPIYKTYETSNNSPPMSDAEPHLTVLALTKRERMALGVNAPFTQVIEPPKT